MTGHFTSADGCQQWKRIDRAHLVYRLPLRYVISVDAPMSHTSFDFSYRTYRLESIEPTVGLAHYQEVRP